MDEKLAMKKAAEEYISKELGFRADEISDLMNISLTGKGGYQFIE